MTAFCERLSHKKLIQAIEPNALVVCRRWYVSGVFRANSGLPLQVVGGDFGGGAHFNVTGTTTFSTVNLFKNPDAATADFRYPLLSSDGGDRSGHPIRGLGLWNLDSRLGKETSFHERFKIEISDDFFNIFKSP